MNLNIAYLKSINWFITFSMPIIAVAGYLLCYGQLNERVDWIVVSIWAYVLGATCLSAGVMDVKKEKNRKS